MGWEGKHSLFTSPISLVYSRHHIVCISPPLTSSVCLPHFTVLDTGAAFPYSYHWGGVFRQEKAAGYGLQRRGITTIGVSVGAQSPSYFEHDADIGIIGRGNTLEQAFESAAAAMFGVATDLDKVQPATRVTVEFEEGDTELALVTWLNQLLGKARESGMVFSRFHIQREGDQWSAEALGEKWHDGLERGVEVKGATLTMLSVKQTGAMWEARCIVDV
jgi:SHS2 domain-containing protein